MLDRDQGGVSILLRMLASPRHQPLQERHSTRTCFNPTQDACFPTTTSLVLPATCSANVSILLRMLASPRRRCRDDYYCSQYCFNPTQDACFPTTAELDIKTRTLQMFQSYSGCLL